MLNEFLQRVSWQIIGLPSNSHPCLILHALMIPYFWRLACYPPFEMAKINAEIYLEMPKYGGHTGFCLSKDKEF